jgi:glutathionylspermidine synthase
MRRVTVEPRPDWRARVEAQGLVFHSWTEGGVERHYWAEGACYELAGHEADAIERATAELHARCMDAVKHVIERRRYAELGLGALAIELVERSWRDREPSLYGRMDLAFGDGVPKLLEYNADTPTSVLEGGVIQWYWRADCRPDDDQANLLHERLVERWRELAPRLGGTLHFGHVCDTYLEDEITIAYLRDTAEQAGLRTIGHEMDDYGWDPVGEELLDLEQRAVRAMFKLYPWEGLLLDELAPVLPRARVTWVEPAWKMLLSNKAILPILWELFPGHPNLLPASRDPLPAPWVRKPLLGREGNNVTVSAPGAELTTPGPYGDRGFVYQAYADLGCHDGHRPVIGAWIVGDDYAGIGIRESESFVTNDEARFVPHVVRSVP